MGWRVGLEHKPHQAKGEIVEQGTDRPNLEHETLDVTHQPLAGLGQVVVINPIEGDAGLGEVVEEVIH